MNTLEKAIELHKRGFNIIPLQENTKEPVKGLFWKKFQYIKQTSHEINNLFLNHNGNIGIICGEPSGNLVVLDADCDKSFEYVYDKLKDYDIKIIKSPRGGHFYLKSTIPIKSKNIVTSYGKIEIRSTGLYVVAEESTHPSGIKYLGIKDTLELPVFKIGQLSEIPEIFFEPDMNETEAKEIIKECGLLNKLDGKNAYKSGSEADMALITFLVRKGYDKDIISDVLIHCGHSSRYSKLFYKNSQRASIWLELSIKKATYLGHSAEFINVKKTMSYLKDMLVKTPITGKKGSSIYKVLLAHLTTCFDSGKQEYHLSVREASEKTGISTITFMKHNKQLINDKIIIAVKRSTGINGNIYKIDTEQFEAYLNSQHTHSLYNTVTNPIVTNCETYGYLGIFEHGSFGHSANQIYNTIRSHNGLMVKEIVLLTGRSVNTVRRVLKKMIDENLLIRDKNTYRAVMEIDLKKYSYEKNYVAKSSKRRYTYTKERIKWRSNKKQIDKIK